VVIPAAYMLVPSRVEAEAGVVGPARTAQPRPESA